MSRATETLPFVSVIVPVFDDTQRLRRCIDALDRQSYPREHYETVVVDNGSPEAPDARALGSPRSTVRIASESLPGSYAARNRGVGLARGEVLAFTDSDCVPAADWLERGVARLLAEPRSGLLAGRVELFCADPRNPSAAELYETLTAFPQERYLESHGFGATANMFTRRAVLERVGPFEASLRSGGDFEWAQRVSSAGFELTYAADATVAHPARASLRELGRKIARVAGGVHVMRRQTGRSGAALLLTAFLPPFRMLRLCGDPRLRGPADRMRVLFVVFWAKYRRAFELLRLACGGSPRR